jgi:hypothetical protein
LQDRKDGATYWPGCNFTWDKVNRIGTGIMRRKRSVLFKRKIRVVDDEVNDCLAYRRWQLNAAYRFGRPY